MKKNALGLAAVLLLSFAFSACGKKKDKPIENVVVIKGDPMNFVAGRDLFPYSTIRVSQIDPKAKYQVSSFVYVNKAVKSAVTYEKTVARQQPPEDKMGKLPRLGERHFRFEDMGRGVYRLIPGSLQDGSFIFQERMNRLELTAVVSVGGSVAYVSSNGFRVLHYSSDPDGINHSILVHANTDQGEALITYTITKSVEPESIWPTSSEAYNYLFGRGVKLGWSTGQDRVLLFCDDDAPDFLFRDMQERVAEWNEPLKGRFELKVERRKRCPPFSDINTNTFGFVKGWVEIPGYKAGIYGTTQFSLDLTRAQFIDSDIFVLSREMQEELEYFRDNPNLFDNENQVSSKFRKTYNHVVLHELGHFLGLSHIFDGTPSIMSYNGLSGLQMYDVRAIQALYPLK